VQNLVAFGPSVHIGKCSIVFWGEFIVRTPALFIMERLGSELGPLRVISELGLADWRSK